ncbi:MAG: DUF4012 domain-containing protein [Acidimicrobiia bacterium]
MGARWAIAFSVAAWLALMGSAGLRRLARDAGPGPDRKFWEGQVRRLGGPLLAAATLSGWLAAPGLPRGFGVVPVVAVAVALVGLVDDRRRLPALARLGLLTAAATAVVAAGIRGAALGEDSLDALLTVAWIVVVTNAFRRLDHADGLAASVTALAGVGLFGVAAGVDDAVSTIPVALVGASVGLLAYNVRPASIAVGPAGAGFAGFVLAVAAVALEPETDGPGGVLIPVLLLGLPVLDLLLVTFARLWRGTSLRRQTRDHLVHRLRNRGWTRTEAFTGVLAAQGALGLSAVLVGRDVIAPAVGAVAGVVVVTAFVFAGAPESSRARARHPGRTALVLAAWGLVALAAAGGFAAWRGLQEVRAAQASLNAALDAGRAGDADAAGVAFADAAGAFERGERWLGPLAWVGRVVPVVTDNLEAARELAGGGADVSRAGAELAQASGERLEVTAGTVDIDEVRRLTPDIEAAARLVREVSARIDGLRRPFLVGPVGDEVDRADAELTQTAGEADRAVAAAHVAPAIFGGDEPRRYFLAIQNPAELRGTGGIIGSWGILTVQDGEVDLENVERTRLLNELGPALADSQRQLDAPPDYVERYGGYAPAQIWQNLNMSPDLPTVGRLIANLAPQTVAGPVDGVVAVDPVGLQALLRLTGPVIVEGWPVPVDASNVIDVTLRQAYDAFSQEEREDFLGDVAEVVWDRATEVELGNPARLARELGRAGRDGHLMLWFADPEEQELAVELGVGGAVPAPRSDSLLVTNQNASANKVDYYLTRRIDYAVELTPDRSAVSADLDGRLELRLDNGAPAGITSFALGPWDERFQPGENRSFVSVYTPLGSTAATLDGLPVPVDPATEIGRNVFSSFLSLPAESSRTFAMDFEGTVALQPGGWYALDLVRQPTLRPDDVSVSVEVPAGWRLAAAEGLEILGPRRAGGRIALHETRQVRVRVVPDPAP